MASLYLIRHGQASFMQANYDQLSPAGYAQAQALGNYFVQHRLQFDKVWCGELVRHHQTYQGAQEPMTTHQLAMPAPMVLPGLNEHQATEVYQHLKGDFLEKDQTLKALLAAKGPHHAEVRRGYIKLFYKAIQLWAKGEVQVEGLENYPDFARRVTAAYHQLAEMMEGVENGIAFTSGGTIGMLIGVLLQLDSERIVELNWQTRNTGITEFSYSKGKFFLRSFNEIPHLSPAMVTYV